MLSRLAQCSLQGSSIGDKRLKRYRTMLVSILLATSAFGQQDRSSELASLLAAAQEAQAGNNYTAAAADYRQAVKLSPDIAEIWANLGLMEHETGDYGGAIRSFGEANRLKPSLYVPNLFLGIDYLRTGKGKVALPFLLKAEKMNAADPLPALTLGRAYSSLGEFRPAVDELQRTIHLDAKQSSAWFSLGIAYLRQVEEDSRAMTGDYAASSYAKALFAESLVKQSRYKEADGVYASVLDAKDQPPCVQSEAGLLHVMQGDAQRAASAFKMEEQTHPECTLAILGEARLRIDAGSNEDALRLLQEAWTRDRRYFSSNISVLVEGMSSETRRSFLEFLNRQRDSGKVESGLCDTLTAAVQGSPTLVDEAAGIPDESQSSSPESARAEYLSGHYGACAGHLRGRLPVGDAGLLQMLAACAFFSNDYELSSDAGRALLATGSHAQAAGLYWSIKANERLALSTLSRFQQLEPNSARSHILLGDIYRQRGQFDDAQQEYTKALEVSPNDPAALLGLASAYFDGAKIDQSIQTAQKALAVDPADPETNLLMGEAFMTQHKFADAEPFLLKSLHAKAQMLPHVHALLGEAYAADGRTQEAISQIRMGLESDQDGSLHYQLARLYGKTGNKIAEAQAIDQMKLLQQRRRDGAVIALKDSHPFSLDDAP
jgi:tetratricopeptide (TPR) repeat protein